MCGAHLSGPNEKAADDLPTINIRLVPPRQPHAQVQAEIGLLEDKSKGVEERLRGLLQQAYNATLLDAYAGFAQIIEDTVLRHSEIFDEQRLGKSINGGYLGASSFIAEQQNTFAIKLNMLAPPPPPLEVKNMLRQLARKRSQQEIQVFEQACREFAALTMIVQKEFEERIHESLGNHANKVNGLGPRVSSFLSKSSATHLPNQVNVRVVAADAKWPSVTDIIQDMQRRQDHKDDSVRELVFNMEMKLLEAENDMMETTLNGVVARFAIAG